MDITGAAHAGDGGTDSITAQAGSLTLTVWADRPWGDQQRYAYRVRDDATGAAVEGRDLFTGAGAPIEPARALRELAGFLSASGEARQHALDGSGFAPKGAGLFPADIAEAARANLGALAALAQGAPRAEPAPECRPVRRWVSVVFLQGEAADEVLDLLDRDGADAAIGHLAGYDYGDETTQAALENGYVYDAPPGGTLDRAATDADGRYTLVYNPFMGHISLLRAYDIPPDPALLGVATPAVHPQGAAADWFAGPARPRRASRGLSL